jgi:hypothetical protein
MELRLQIETARKVGNRDMEEGGNLEGIKRQTERERQSY